MKQPLKITITLVSFLVLVLFGQFTRTIIHETVQTHTANQQYVVAMGDSVAAGLGLGDSDSRKGAGCGVSAAAFPFLLGQQLNKPVEQFACSGATVAGATNSLLSTQYAAAQSFLSGSDVVVNAGANDTGWLQALTSCAQTDCSTAGASAATLASKVRLLQQNLTTLLTRVQQQHPHRLVVNTYYDLLANDDTCFEKLGITPQKVSFIHDEEQVLNAAITAAATNAKATTVQVDFSGHTLCSAQPWIQEITDRAPLHPTAAGQQQIARQDAQAFAMSLGH